MARSERQRTFDPEDAGTLEVWLQQALAATRVAITQARLLGGGAIQENWKLDVDVTDGPRAGIHQWVMRTDAAVRLSLSLDRLKEFEVLKAVHDAGVRVAEPVVRCDDSSVIGRPFLIQAFQRGEAQAIRVVRDPGVARWGPDLAAALGDQLALIHSIRPGQTRQHALDAMLALPQGDPAVAAVALLRAALKNAGEPRPALSYVFKWLEDHAPAPQANLTLVHGDFRTGNYMVEEGMLRAILDWEFAHWGDPDEDIGWLCAKCWRFGQTDRPVGGIAQSAPFLTAYAERSGRMPDARRVQYWEIMAAAKWAAIAVLQGDRYRLGGEESIELALTGLMASEIELEALDGINAFERG